MDLLDDFAEQVVVSRRDSGVRKWTRWFREDLGARPSLLVVKDPLTETSRILVELILLMLSSVRPGCLSSVGLVNLLLLLISSWILLVIFSLTSLIWLFFGLRDGICRRWLVPKKLLQVDWMVGLGM